MLCMFSIVGCCLSPSMVLVDGSEVGQVSAAVSYTHLDVYKRQALGERARNFFTLKHFHYSQ